MKNINKNYVKIYVSRIILICVSFGLLFVLFMMSSCSFSENENISEEKTEPNIKLTETNSILEDISSIFEISENSDEILSSKLTNSINPLEESQTANIGQPNISQEQSETDETFYDISENSFGFVILSEVVPDAILEIRYYSTYNFIGEKIPGYEQPIALLTKEAALALRGVSHDLMNQGYRLKIYDAYRPTIAVDYFVNWAENTEDTRMKEYFYPDIDKSDMFYLGYIAHHSGHSRGSTVDVTLVDMKTGKDVDMGGVFDYFGTTSHVYCESITDFQYNNRMILQDAMVSNGFHAINEEWWHFTLDNEPYPNTYFDFPVSYDIIKR